MNKSGKVGGSWDSDAWVKSVNGFSNFDSVIRPKEGQTYAFEIETYSDRMNN